jgi:hypothetical protein
VFFQKPWSSFAVLVTVCSLNLLDFSTTSCCPGPASSPDIIHVTSFYSNFSQLRISLFSSQIRHHFLCSQWLGVPLQTIVTHSFALSQFISGLGEPIISLHLPYIVFLVCCLLLLVSCWLFYPEDGDYLVL